MAEAEKPRERRRFPRAGVQLEAICETRRDSSPAIVHSLSPGGAFIQSPTVEPVGATVRVGLMLPGGRGEIEWLDGRVARVVDVLPSDGSLEAVTGMGIEFRVSAEQRKRLEELIAACGPRATPPSRRANRSTIGSDEATLRLWDMRAGQRRSVRLRLMAILAQEQQPTQFFLEAKILCQGPQGPWDADVKVDFGRRVPSAATVTVLKDRYEASSALPLVEGGACVEQEIPLPIERGVEKLVFWVVTDGSSGVPERMACAIHVEPPGTEEPDEDLDTMRLPTVKAVLSRNLADVLRKSPDSSLAVLGELMASGTSTGKIARLRQLVESNADLRLIEAGVRDIELWERMGRDFGRVDFSTLSLDDPVHLCIVVFHGMSAPLLLARAFRIAFESSTTGRPPAERGFWSHLSRCAAGALSRRDRSALRAMVRRMRKSENAATADRLEELVEQAGRSTRRTPTDLSTRLDDYAEDILGRGARPPLAAAVELMTAAGFIALFHEDE